MNFSAWAIRRPTPPILLFFMLTVAGLVAFQHLGIQSFPDADFPTVTVAASLPGASPVQLEAEVARPLEDAIAGISSVRHVTTTINDGMVNIAIEFAYEKDLQEATTDVRDAVTRSRTILPAELQEPVVARVNMAGLPILTYAVAASNMDEADLSWFVDDVVSKALLQLPGVARIQRQGGVSREIRVELDTVRLQALKVTAGEISSQLRSMQQEAPGGRGDLGGLEQTVRTLGTVSSAEELANLSLPLADGRRLRLADVATVSDTISERRQLALLDGEPIISFDVTRARGHDEVRTGRAVRTALEELQQAHPRVEFREIAGTVDYSLGDYKIAMRVLYEGAALAVLVVFLFLRDWRATIISALSLPLSIIPTFLFILVLGYNLNVLTLLALTLVIGILVDDAIVEVENIMRHLRMGKPPLQAAREAADEIGLAVVATSLTMVAVFLPTAFVGGITGAFFREFGWTASAAVLFSLMVARLLTPMMAAYLLKPQPVQERNGPLMLAYLKAVRWCLAHRIVTLVSTTIFFLVSLLMLSHLPIAFIAAQDTSTEIVMIEGPPGIPLRHTAALARRASALIAEVPDVKSVYATIGTGAQAGGSLGMDGATSEVRSIMLTVRLLPHSERGREVDEIRLMLREQLSELPGARVSIGRGSPGEKMVLKLAGDDPHTLQAAARQVETELRGLRGIGAVTSTASLRRPEIVVRPDFARAAELGITSAAIGQAVRVATTGDYDFNLPRLNLPGRQLYVRVQLDPESRRDPDLVAQLRIKGESGAAVPLRNIADIEITDGPAQINRHDRQRYIGLSVDLQDRPVGEVLAAAQALPSLQNLPPGVKLVLSGDIEHMDEMFGQFILAMLAGIFCIYAIMVLLFDDFGQPVTVLAALPLASTGALGMLWLFGYVLSMSALIGLLMLIGIVTKNSILLIDYAIVARRDFGMSRLDALVDSCHKRARPIVMTTFAMGAGMSPIAFSLIGDDSFRAPMAVVVIGGLITSTILSLLVVPVVFEVVDDVKQRVMGYLPTRAAQSRHHPLA